MGCEQSIPKETRRTTRQVSQDAGDVQEMGRQRTRVGCILFAGCCEKTAGCIPLQARKEVLQHWIQKTMSVHRQTPLRSSCQTLSTTETYRSTSQHAASTPIPFRFSTPTIRYSSLTYLSDELGLYPKVVHLLPRRHQHCRRAGNRLKMGGINEPYSTGKDGTRIDLGIYFFKNDERYLRARCMYIRASFGWPMRPDHISIR